jgi:perosamine synthetase
VTPRSSDEAGSTIRLFQPELGEEELDAVREVFRSGTLTDGPVVERFEHAFAHRHGTRHAVAFSSGTSALAAMHLALGIGPGDEVVVPSMTFISTATSVLHVGATPVFAEVRPDTLTLDAEDVARRITARTRAVLAVHYGGQAADLAALAEVAQDAGVVLLEDAAEAHGASYQGRPVGSFGGMAMFSFTPTKNMTTGEGGMVTTDDPELDTRLRLLRNHGQDGPDHHTTMGFNWRLSEVQAAIGLVQLGKLDDVIAAKRANAAILTSALADAPGATPPHEAADRDHVFMLYTVLLEDDRDRVAKGLDEVGIESRVYFPPAHLQPVFAGPPPDLPVTERLGRQVLSLPVHPALREDQLLEVAKHVSDLAAGELHR